MFRMLKIALFSATVMVAACKKADPADTKPAEATKVDPAKPADPAVKPADPVAKPADPAVKPAATGQNSELETKGIAMMQQMGDLFASNVKDCDKLADGIKGFITQNKPLLAQLSALEKGQSDAEKKAFEARNVGTQEEVMKKMEPAMKACGENPKVLAAMKEFPTD
ncbi:MAG: hypothetical protein ABIY55_21565 [Kofleriaceae bacterium]